MLRKATMFCAAVLAVGLLALPHSVHAQGLAVGVEGGVTFSDLSVSDGAASADLGSQTGYRVAGVLRYGFGGALGIQTGVGYATKGAEEGAASLDLAYFEVPMLLTLTIPTGPAPVVSPRLFAGPQASFETSCELGDVDCASEDLADPLDTKSTEYSLVVGGGLDFAFGGPVGLTVDGRYDLGLSDITEDPTSVKNRSFSISAGLVFGLP